MVYSIPERKFILEIYLKTKSYKKVRQLLIKKFNKKFNKKGPLDKYIQSWTNLTAILKKLNNF
jgi:hypothetical protein